MKKDDKKNIAVKFIVKNSIPSLQSHGTKGLFWFKEDDKIGFLDTTKNKYEPKYFNDLVELEKYVKERYC